MSAGSQLDHFEQDTSEAYFLYCLGQALHKQGRLSPRASSLEDLKREYAEYAADCKSKNGKFDFSKSIYKKMVDESYRRIALSLMTSFPDATFSLENVEKEARNSGSKEDFLLGIHTATVDVIKKVSMKQYKKGADNIQLISGTWFSMTVAMFLSEFRVGVGKLLDPVSQKEFKASSRPEKTFDLVRHKYDPATAKLIIEFLKEAQRYQHKIKELYTKGDRYEHLDDTKLGEIKALNKSLGTEAASKFFTMLEKLDQQLLSESLLNYTGLSSSDDMELLVLSAKGKNTQPPMFSLYDAQLKRISCISKDEQFNFYPTSNGEGQSVQFVWGEPGSPKCMISIPFAINLNGAWALQGYTKAEKVWSEKDKQWLVWGTRRNKKCKEISTSTNVWWYLKKVL